MACHEPDWCKWVQQFPVFRINILCKWSFLVIPAIQILWKKKSNLIKSWCIEHSTYKPKRINAKSWWCDICCPRYISAVLDGIGICDKACAAVTCHIYMWRIAAICCQPFLYIIHCHENIGNLVIYKTVWNQPVLYAVYKKSLLAKQCTEISVELLIPNYKSSTMNINNYRKNLFLWIFRSVYVKHMCFNSIISICNVSTASYSFRKC